MPLKQITINPSDVEKRFFQKHDVFGIFSYIEAISSIEAFKINLIIMFAIMLIVRHHLILLLCFLHI